MIHAALAFITLVPLLAAWFVPLGKLPLMPCTFLWLTGYPCPFCGVTRAFWAVADGRWSEALAVSPLGVAVYGGTAFVFAWNAAALLLGVVLLPGRWPMSLLRRRRLMIGVVVGVIVLNWGYRLYNGMQ